MQEIVIGTLNRIKSGMMLTIYRYDVKQCDIIRQDPVPTKKQIEVPLFFDINMKKILAGMNTSICSTAAVDYDWMLKYFA